MDTSNWIGGVYVLVPTALIRHIDWTTWLAIEATEEVRSAPRYDPAQPLDRTISIAVARHYGLPTDVPAESARGAGGGR